VYTEQPRGVPPGAQEMKIAEKKHQLDNVLEESSAKVSKLQAELAKLKEQYSLTHFVTYFLPHPIPEQVRKFYLDPESSPDLKMGAAMERHKKGISPLHIDDLAKTTMTQLHNEKVESSIKVSELQAQLVELQKQWGKTQESVAIDRVNYSWGYLQCQKCHGMYHHDWNVINDIEMTNLLNTIGDSICKYDIPSDTVWNMKQENRARNKYWQRMILKPDCFTPITVPTTPVNTPPSSPIVLVNCVEIEVYEGDASFPDVSGFAEGVPIVSGCIKALTKCATVCLQARVNKHNMQQFKNDVLDICGILYEFRNVPYTQQTINQFSQIKLLLEAATTFIVEYNQPGLRNRIQRTFNSDDFKDTLDAYRNRLNEKILLLNTLVCFEMLQQQQQPLQITNV